MSAPRAAEAILLRLRELAGSWSVSAARPLPEGEPAERAIELRGRAWGLGHAVYIAGLYAAMPDGHPLAEAALARPPVSVPTARALAARLLSDLADLARSEGDTTTAAALERAALELTT